MRPNTEADFWRRVNRDGPTRPHMATPCWEWTGSVTQVGGYGQFAWRNGTVKSHRIAWEFVNGPVPDGLDVLHRCDNPRCVHAEPNGGGHLFLGTNDDNMADMVAKGRQARGERHVSRTRPDRVPRGERHGSRSNPERLARGDRNGSRLHPERLKRGEDQWSAKLTEAHVVELRALYAAGDVRQVDLAARFGVTQAVVSKIVRGVLWGHVPTPTVGAGAGS